MPFQMFVINPPLIVVRKNPGHLEIETASGRNVLFFAYIWVLTFQVDWVRYPGILLFLIIMTYSKRWIFDRESNTVQGVGWIGGMKYYFAIDSLDHIEEIYVLMDRKTSRSRPFGRLRIRFLDGTEVSMATRNVPAMFEAIVRECCSYIPARAFSFPLRRELKRSFMDS